MNKFPLCTILACSLLKTATAYAGEIVTTPKTLPNKPNNIIIIFEPSGQFPLLLNEISNSEYDYNLDKNIFGEASLELTSIPDNFSGLDVLIRIPYYKIVG